jgi:hypothetical protein
MGDLQRMREYLENLVYKSCGNLFSTGDETAMDVADYIGCINTIKCADNSFISIFIPTSNNTFTTVVASNNLAETQADLESSAPERVDSAEEETSHHHTTDLDDIHSPIRNEKLNNFGLIEERPTVPDLASSADTTSKLTEYGASNLIRDVQAWLRKKRCSKTMNILHQGEIEEEFQGSLITSQCHLVIVVLHLLWTNPAVESVRLKHIGKLRPLKQTSETPKKKSRRRFKSMNDANMLEDICYSGKRIEQLATGRYRVFYTTLGKVISIDLAFLTDNDLTFLTVNGHQHHQHPGYIQFNDFIRRTLLDAYKGHELTVVDTCRQGSGLLCHYNFRPLAVVKLPMVLLHQASKFNLESFLMQKLSGESDLLSESDKVTLHSYTNVAMVFVQHIKKNDVDNADPFALFCDSTTQYLSPYQFIC